MQTSLNFATSTPRLASFDAPSLDGINDIALDTETTGLDWRHKDRLVGISVYPPGVYLPVTHQGGGNMDEGKVRQWCLDNLQNKRIGFVNPSMDLGMMRKFGVDLEELGNQPYCVQHHAALISDHRRKYTLESLAMDFIGKSKKTMPSHMPIHVMPAWEVRPYAIHDAQLTHEVGQELKVKLAEQNLERVAELEDQLIYSTLSMERQGVRLDMPKLRRWIDAANIKFSSLCERLSKHAGFQLNPGSSLDLDKFFRRVGIPIYVTTDGGDDSYTELSLLLSRESVTPEHQLLIDDILAARQIKSLLSKYLLKYWRAAVDGRLYYNLHQLRGDDYGTITGRYSSSNVNIQQVFAVENQDTATLEWIIRELFIPDEGMRWWSADASQIEFRLFAHYSGSQRLINAYRDDPNVDFHVVVARIIEWKRKQAKNVNFARLYGEGDEKLARQLGIPLEEAIEKGAQYDKEFPEAKALMWEVIKVVKRRRYVRTFLGRRRRYPDLQRLHSALNAVLQGTAADLMKLKILKIYKEQRRLGLKLQMTVHDEVGGSMHPDADVKKIKEVFNEQEVRLKVPILWDFKTGDNWRLGL